MKTIHKYKFIIMKTLIQHKTIKKVRITLVLILLGFVSLLTSCYDSDDVGGNYYTFTGEMMGQYFKANPEKFSEFTKMLDTTGVMGLLNAYGSYTCFAPTNEALFKYYAEKGRSSIYQFPMDSIRKMVFNHLINGVIITSSEFKNGRLPYVSMGDRYFTTKPTISDQ